MVAPRSESVTLAILAGGASRRMGRDKGLIDLNGRPLVAHVIEAGVKGANAFGVDGPEVLVIANSAGYGEFGGIVYPDLRPGLGPLAGIESALTHASSDRVAVIACDMPFACAELVTRLISALGSAVAAVPVGPTGIEPCLAAYRRSCLPVVSGLVDRGELKARHLPEEIEAAGIGDVTRLGDLSKREMLSIGNVNTASDLEEAARLFNRFDGA